MRVLVLGATGMLGHAVFMELAKDPNHETFATLRGDSGRRFFGEPLKARLVVGVDVNDLNSVVGVLGRLRPDVVINAVGLIKQLGIVNNPLAALPVNAEFPHRLAGLCSLLGARLVILSTDCVFSGRKGAYVEADTSDAEDLYGKSKYLGEVHHLPHVITLRTSGIGHELATNNGLLEWFLSQGGEVKGYARAIYSGLPSIELARVIREYVLPRPALNGLYHVSSAPIAKLELLQLIARQYGKNIRINPDDSVALDRSLNSTRFTEATGYVAASWPGLIAQMHEHRASTTEL